MADVDGLSCRINILIHRYFTQPSRVRANDIVQRPFVNSYDYFNTCSNPRCVTSPDTTITIEASSFLPSLSIIHHFPINSTFTPIAQPYSALSPKTYTFHHIVLPEVIMWLFFDTVTTSFGFLLFLWSGDSVTNFSFETDPKNYHIYSFLPSSTPSTSITLSHSLHHLQLLIYVKLLQTLM